MTGRIWHRTLIAAALAGALSVAAGARAEGDGLWSVYNDALKSAKYVDLTHTITPDIPVWSGFADSTFAPAKAGSDIEGYARKGDTYSYDKHGFEATEYHLNTDQLGTQLDPPAHWAPEYPAIDELPATYTIRPLVVISIVDQLKNDANYALRVSDIEAWEKAHGKIPEGSVVFVRSDWSKAWPDKTLATLKEFPGVSLDALKFLHEERHILFHGHEPLDTDSTPTLEGEDWLMHHGYAQAEGVANLDKVPETGALVAIGYPKFGGGLGGYARYVAICPSDWQYGVTIGENDAPLPKSDKKLHFDETAGMRVR
ncbi:cyclase family protein [Aurantimonas sp. VKM B-3413]|uniref:cyclase family protein n=1 Tax=Aurantimonas sp. VKM B-3413 TaxID=2779401 RepID=UPI001E39ED0C|nr:cyclase family protein [Aurantimonas sp. VKM B-3413]MCB8838947.1 cyclase family protein [Aurantimonas sp. VKM B-3413]